MLFIKCLELATIYFTLFYFIGRVSQLIRTVKVHAKHLSGIAILHTTECRNISYPYYFSYCHGYCFSCTFISSIILFYLSVNIYISVYFIFLLYLLYLSVYLSISLSLIYVSYLFILSSTSQGPL